MSKRPTVLEKLIARLDAKIAALQLARQELIEEQQAQTQTRKPATAVEGPR